MKIQAFSLHSYQIPMTTGQVRFGVLVHMKDEKGNEGWGDVAPLPHWSDETLDQSLLQLKDNEQAILEVDWTTESYLKTLKQFAFYPSVSFGVESALLSLLAPLPKHRVVVSALLMGSPQEIIKQAQQRHSEGVTSAKLKVSHLSFEEAARLIVQLKDTFRLRIDVNRAWETEDSLRFFSQFPKDAFDYVEEPFKNSKELKYFQHPLAIDESFPKDLSLEQLEELPMLKALIYKPTIQGGLLGCLPLYEWSKKRGVSIVLSSSFESDVGLAHVASMAYRLSLSSPVGIGTYHYLTEHLCQGALQISQAHGHISSSYCNPTCSIEI